MAANTAEAKHLFFELIPDGTEAFLGAFPLKAESPPLS
jgi:hypothetical protein